MPDKTTTRQKLDALLDTLSPEQLVIVLGFTEALARGRAVAAVCEPLDGEEQADVSSTQ